MSRAVCNDTVIITGDADRVMSAPEAAAAAGITYRQLDYWDRQKWIRPSDIHRVGSGRAVRRYGLNEVVRLQALAHLGRSGVELAAFAPTINGVELGPDDALLVGPFGVTGSEPEAFVVARDDALGVASTPGR